MEVVGEAKTLHEEVSLLLVSATRKLNDATARTSKSAIYDSLIIPSGELDLSYSTRNVMSVQVPEIKVDEVRIKNVPFSFSFTSASLDEAVLSLKRISSIKECHKRGMELHALVESIPDQDPRGQRVGT